MNELRKVGRLMFGTRPPSFKTCNADLFFCISSVILALTENFVFCFTLSILTQITEIPRFSVVLSIRLQVIENDDCDSIKFNMTIEESATKLCRSFTRRTNLL